MSSHITMSLEGNASILSKSPAPEFEVLDIEGWRGAALEDVGLFTFMFNIEADAPVYPIHSDEAQWIAYVISGNGILYSGDHDGNQKGHIEYQAGDFITFMPNTPHGWKNGNANSKILLVKQAG